MRDELATLSSEGVAALPARDPPRRICGEGLPAPRSVYEKPDGDEDCGENDGGYTESASLRREAAGLTRRIGERP